MDHSELFALPSVALADRLKMPHSAAVYFALSSAGQVLYVGSAIDLRVRWSSHRLLADEFSRQVARIAWQRCDFKDAIRLESDLIRKLDPPLNVLGKPKPPVAPPVKPVPALVSGTVISQEFGIPRATLYRLVDQGRLPAVEVTKPWHQKKRYLFSRDAIRVAIQQMQDGKSD